MDQGIDQNCGKCWRNGKENKISLIIEKMLKKLLKSGMLNDFQEMARLKWNEIVIKIKCLDESLTKNKL